MSKLPEELRYTETHEWVKPLDDGTLRVGITDHAQELLGDMVFIELPEVGSSLSQGEECGVVESVKAASDIYAPLAGEVAEINDALTDQPEVINQDPYGEGWLFRLRPVDSKAVDALLTPAAYASLIASEES